MQLYLDDQLISEHVTEKELDAVLRQLEPQHTYSIMLVDEGTGFMTADGSPENGYAIRYTDDASGITMVSTNKELRPVTTRRMLTQFLTGDSTWRHAVGWVDQRQAPRTAAEKRNIRRVGVAVFIVLFGFAAVWVPLVFFADDIIDQIMFIPYCRAYNTDQQFVRYSTGGITSTYDGGLGILQIRTVQLGNCFYDDEIPVPVSMAIGDEGRAYILQTVANLLIVPLPFLLLGVLIGVAVLFLRFTDPERKGRKAHIA
ncbi:hypothetical protein VZO05_09725 [Aggregatilineales bacterium SYSU G02658]